MTDFPTIIFDVDNVLADSMSSFCKKASKLLSFEVNKQHIKNHKVVGSVPLSPQTIFKLQGEVWADWQNLSCIENNLSKKMHVFQKFGFEIYLATATPLRFIPFVKNWLKKKRIPYSKFFHCQEGCSKSDIQADALIDDAPEEVRSFITSGRKGFLYQQPWNVNVKIRKVINVKNLDEVLKYYGVTKSDGGTYKDTRWGESKSICI